VERELRPRLDHTLRAVARGSGGVLLAGGNYGAGRLGVPALGPAGRDTGAGHRYQSPHRLAALRWFADGPGWQPYREPNSIGRSFGNAGSFGGGVGPPPNGVGRLGRVTRWVWCEPVINAHRILRNREHMQQMQ